MQLSLSVNNLRDLDLYHQAVSLSQLSESLDYVEILWDGYCHLPPEEIQTYLAPFSNRIALHVMWSRFLDRDSTEFQNYLQHFKHHVDVLKPIYVSDHLCRFTLSQLHLFQPIEWNYQDLNVVIDRVDEYQQTLGRQLLVENYASGPGDGQAQIDYFERLMAQTGCGILFDISNARVAENNGSLALSDWLSFLRNLPPINCHLGSYSYDPQKQQYFDSHDQNMELQTVRDVEHTLQQLQPATLTYEREHQRTAEEMAADLDQLAHLNQLVHV